MDYLFINKILSSRKNIVITTHKTPDGDALGSSLALLHLLKDNHNVTVVVPNEYPRYLKWLPLNDQVLIYEGGEQEGDVLINKADVIFCLDFNKLYRTYTMSSVIKNSQACKIMIDHHEDPDDFCDQVLSDPSISSTAELVFDFIVNIKEKLNQNISICLYTGIITDTGSLKYPNVTPKTHYIVSELMKFNINHTLIHGKLYNSQNKSRLDLLKICLNNLTFFHHYGAAATFLMESDLVKYNYTKGDTEGFVNMPLSIKGVTFSAFFVEFKDGIKVSFRSEGEFDVNLFSRKYFNGGGHINASGGFIGEKDMKQTMSYFLECLKKYVEK